MNRKLRNSSLELKLFYLFDYLIIIFTALACVVPFLMILSGSFTSEKSIINEGYSLWPKEFSLKAYETIFANPGRIIDSYGVTAITTLIGTTLSVFLSSMAGYVLHRKDFPWRNQVAFFFYFTTLFSGGLTPWYMLMMKLGMKNNLWALILPHLFSVFNILIIRNFMSGIPYEITESAKVDGANDFYIYIKLIIPLSKPVLATVALFTGLRQWNEWYNCMLFISDQKKVTLQYFLYNMLNNTTALKELAMQTSIDLTKVLDLPSESAKLAMAMIATGPILLLYPFVQKYFVQGISVGAVKG